ncbi:MAG: hypothetical protein Ctma_1606 [Catillopecten margaritatus gill symbiont]|uniref:Cytochrome c domain-containing protein n=1 Tax=Catillopecten margaritatus gill symbiont TaxID=3083288 RepID=A0AAU6PIM0_9GAMM
MVLISTTAFANEGQELHEESCVACHRVQHDDAFYMRDDRKMSDFPALRTQVSMCANVVGAGWFPEEEKTVLDYLNKQHYKFK